jgi:hypothetical protein
MKKKRLSSNTLREVVGWTLVRNQYETTKFEVEHFISYRRRPASFPCLVQDRITSDENSETDILSLGDVQKMLALLTQANAEISRSGIPR